MRGPLTAALVLALAVASSVDAHADDGIRFRRTTPRAALATAERTLVLGVPGGRAWGVESDLRPLPAAGTVLVVRLGVRDGSVREAFVRVAYYASATARTRQLAVADSEPVTPGRSSLAAIELDPPHGAVAFRVRVLARVAAGDTRSTDTAVIATLPGAHAGSRAFGSLYTRLLP